MAIRLLRLAIAAVDRQVAEKWLFHCGARAGVPFFCFLLLARFFLGERDYQYQLQRTVACYRSLSLSVRTSRVLLLNF